MREIKPVIAAKAKEKMLAGVKPKDPEQIFAQGTELKQEETVDDRKTNAQIAEQAQRLPSCIDTYQRVQDLLKRKKYYDKSSFTFYICNM